MPILPRPTATQAIADDAAQFPLLTRPAKSDQRYANVIRQTLPSYKAKFKKKKRRRTHDITPRPAAANLETPRTEPGTLDDALIADTLNFEADFVGMAGEEQLQTVDIDPENLYKYTSALDSSTADGR